MIDFWTRHRPDENQMHELDDLVTRRCTYEALYSVGPSDVDRAEKVLSWICTVPEYLRGDVASHGSFRAASQSFSRDTRVGVLLESLFQAKPGPRGARSLSPPEGKLLGTVHNLVAIRGYGFVVLEDGSRYFFHRSSMRSDVWDGLHVGAAVSFRLGSNHQGACAIDVDLMSDPADPSRP
jgi:cold shock CspA family protein